ncbi:transketolase [Sporanaerobium hydrogeniformans]|uniref:Transketolase n=1 Tax=Sporanaerobium hydrogeniformans TaxID=3072179 RepID=A0AC61DCG1_9FIRM|nr:transketolase C-terminal domain-containing protein [Sporanaerobium hydrogeniformans]PHV70438.1 transketolase [Sporanaerobium hydrogeniformans]
MNNIPNRQVICEVLLEKAAIDKDVIVLCSDSRGSASLEKFANTYPSQFVEVGIAEQSLVSISAGLARCGKKVFAASPACFLSTRSMEQCKVDVAYSNTNVKLIGISGGISYGALGMTHHSAQDIATLAAIPNMRVYLPSDRHQTRKLIEQIGQDEKPAYIRVGRNPVEDVYDESSIPFELDKASIVTDGDDLTIIACGEMVKPSQDAALELKKQGINVRVIDMYCLKPLDKEVIIKAAKETKRIITIEEHSPIGGLGTMVSQVVAEHYPVKVKNLALPDEAVVAGKSQEVFDYYRLNAKGLIETAMELINDGK